MTLSPPTPADAPRKVPMLSYQTPFLPSGKKATGSHVITSIPAIAVFWPAGVFALGYSVKTFLCNRRGDFAQARGYANLAAVWGMAAIGLFMLGALVVAVSALIIPVI